MSVLSLASTLSSATHYSSAASNSQFGAPESIHSNLSANSSSLSLGNLSVHDGDDEDVTIRVGIGDSSSHSNGGESQDGNLRILAISTHITELSYAISDIQTRIFEIQELRHKSQAQLSSSGDSGGVSSSPNSRSDANNVSTIIDQSLISLDERLESTGKGIKVVTENLEPHMTPSTPGTAKTITPGIAVQLDNSDEVNNLLRKHAALLQEWESVQDESGVLREELKEDKWLTVFRTVTDQADGMMSSLEKAVNRCQEFIYQVHNRRHDEFLTPSGSRDHQPLNLDTFNSLLDSYEAKKKHYTPATSKVLAIIDRGVRDRVTKNGETLRRHSESAQRWRRLKERIARMDVELEAVRKLLMGAEAALSESGTENGSSTSGTLASTSQVSQNGGYLATPPNGRKGEKAISLSRSISPFRKFARKITGGSSKSASSSGSSRTRNATSVDSPPSSVATSLTASKKLRSPPIASTISAPPTQTLRRQRTSLFSNQFRGHQEALTPDKFGHKHSQSVTPESSPRIVKLEDSTASADQHNSNYSTPAKGRSTMGATPRSVSASLRPGWNSSTKVDDDKGRPPRAPSRVGSRPPSSTGMYRNAGYDEVPPVPPIGLSATPSRRSVSRQSMVAPSRPWSPQSSSISTSHSSAAHHTPPVPTHMYTPNCKAAASRPPSRAGAQTPSRSFSHGAAPSISHTPRRHRPKTPSQIPGPTPNYMRSISSNWSPGEMHSPENRAYSPTFSTVSGVSASGTTPGAHPPRPPSRSMIPVPSVHLNATTPGGRSSSSMSHIMGGYSYGRAGAESPTQRMAQFRAGARRAQTPDLMSMGRGPSGRPSLPPSSFRDGGASAAAPPLPSRPDSRAGSHTPNSSMFEGGAVGPQVNLTDGDGFTFEYIVENPKDPLDAEVGRIVNSIPHNLVVERLDPPLRKMPREGEEVKAAYAFSNAFGKKVITCRLTTLTRATRVPGEGEGAKGRVTMVTTKKVMCRVGGGWQDLNVYIMNRQAGM